MYRSSSHAGRFIFRAHLSPPALQEIKRGAPVTTSPSPPCWCGKQPKGAVVRRPKGEFNCGAIPQSRRELCHQVQVERRASWFPTGVLILEVVCPGSAANSDLILTGRHAELNQKSSATLQSVFSYKLRLVLKHDAS